MTVLSHTHPLVIQLETDLLPLFRAALPDLTSTAPQALASVFAFSSGNASAFQDYHFGISCLLDDAAADGADEVALLVSVTDLEQEAQLSAQVAWGPPSRKIEAQAVLSTATMEALHAGMPALLAALQAAARRGQP